jgi:hypothetical protein
VLEIAKARAEQSLDTLIHPLIENVADYHNWLNSLFSTGKMPADYIKAVDRLKKGK